MARVSRFSLRLFLVSLLLVACSAFFGGGKKEAAVKTGGAKTVDELQIGIKKRPEKCEQLATDGDHVWVHYRGTLLASGEQFDASYDRNQPFDFTLGAGNVIKGWDLGVAGMCPGEVRKLKVRDSKWVSLCRMRPLLIPAALGYGASGSPPKIPGGASLVFQVELLSIGAPPK